MQLGIDDLAESHGTHAGTELHQPRSESPGQGIHTTENYAN